MSHESIGPYGTTLYTMPSTPSDVLRSVRFSQFFESYHGVPFSVRTCDGWNWTSSSLRLPVFTATFRTRQRLDAVIDGAFELRRAFLAGNLEIRGDSAALLSVAEYVLSHSVGLSGSLVQTLGRATLDMSKRLREIRRSPATRNWRSIICPFDLPAEFFRQWLGPSLGHICGSFRETEGDFSTAQEAALERACRSLELERDDRLLEIGAGWGSLVLYSGLHHRAGAQGITDTEQQAEAAMERVKQMGLQRLCDVSYRDLRAAPFRPESFDKMADVGMFEQAESRDLRAYLGCLRRMLAPGGLLLLHRVTRSPESKAHRTATLYPEAIAAGSLATLPKDLEIAEAAGFSVVRVESLREDYEQTLRYWISRLQSNLQMEMEDPGNAASRAARIWLLYLVETVTSLQAGDLQVHKLLLRKLAQPRRFEVNEIAVAS